MICVNARYGDGETVVARTSEMIGAVHIQRDYFDQPGCYIPATTAACQECAMRTLRDVLEHFWAPNGCDTLSLSCILIFWA